MASPTDKCIKTTYAIPGEDFELDGKPNSKTFFCSKENTRKYMEGYSGDEIIKMAKDHSDLEDEFYGE